MRPNWTVVLLLAPLLLAPALVVASAPAADVPSSTNAPTSTTTGDEPVLASSPTAQSAAGRTDATTEFDATWMASGTFSNTAMPESNTALDDADLLHGYVFPQLTTRSLGAWWWNNPFSGSSTSAPTVVSGMTNCAPAYQSSDGSKMTSSVTSGATSGHNGWCMVEWDNAAAGGLLSGDYSTVAASVWMENAWTATSGNRGTDLSFTADEERAWFSAVDDGSGGLVPKMTDKRDGSYDGISCGAQTVAFPPPSASAEWHEWRTVLDRTSRMGYFYQDGILRCRGATSPNTASSVRDNGVMFSTYGGGGDAAESHFDWVAMDAGAHVQHANGTWTSPSISAGDRQWSTLSIDWWMPGVGTCPNDVAATMRWSLLDAGNLQPLVGFDDRVPSETSTLSTTIDMTTIDRTQDVRLHLEWKGGLVDFVGAGDITLNLGASVAVDLAPGNTTFSGANGDLPRSGLPITAVTNLSLNGESIPAGQVTTTIRVDGALQTLVNHNLLAWPTSGWSTTLPALAVGDHVVTVEVDVQDNVSEASEVNNLRNTSLRVHPTSAPVTNLTGDITGLPAGTTVALAVDPTIEGLAIETLHVDWGDGTEVPIAASGGLNLTYTWQAVTTHTVTMWAELAGGFQTPESSFNVSVVNVPPVAVISVNGLASQIDDFVTFSCADSIDSPVEPLACSWTSSDGGSAPDATNFYHQFTHLGIHTISLSVRDPFGATDVTSMEWLVSRGPVNGTVLELVAITNTTFHEGGSVDVRVVWNRLASPVNKSTVQMTWTIDGVTTTPSLQSPDIWRVTVPTSASPGTISIGLDTYWVDGSTPLVDQDTMPVEVLNRPPMAFYTLTPLSASEDLEVILDWSSSADDPWDTAGLTANLSAPGATIRVLSEQRFGLIWSTATTHDFLLTVTDGDGDSDVVNGSISVSNVAPSFTLRCFQDTVVRLTVECVVDDVNDTASDVEDLEFDWDWDDDQVSILTDLIQRHRYADAGTYNITLVITDDDGSEAVQVVTLEVELPEDTGTGESEGLLGGVDNGLTLILIAAGVGLLIVLGAVLTVTMIMSSNKDDDERASVHDQRSAFDEPDDTWSSPAGAPAAGTPPATAPHAAPAATAGLRNGPDGHFQQGPDGYWYRSDGYGGFETVAYVMGPDGMLYVYQG